MPESGGGLPPPLGDAVAGLGALAGQATREAVACGIVVETWRYAVEPLHDHVTQAEMSFMSVVTTRDVLPSCAPGTVDWAGVRMVLLDADREVLPARTAADVAGRGWSDLRTRIRHRIAEIERRPILLHAVSAQMLASEWWGMPSWPTRAAQVVASGSVTSWDGSDDALVDALVNAPADLPFDVWIQVVAALV